MNADSGDRSSQLSRQAPAAPAEAIAWEAPHGLGIKPFVSDRIYQMYSPKVQRFYKPFRCASCAEPVSPAPAKLVAEVEIHDEGLKAWIEHFPLPDGRHKLYVAPTPAEPAQQDWKDDEAATIPKLTIQTHSTPPAEQAAPTWADLLFAFGGFLTCHDKRWVFSSHDDASPMVEAIREFAAREGINLDATPPAEKQAAPSGEGNHG